MFNITNNYDASIRALLAFVTSYYRYSKLPERLSFANMRKFLFSTSNGNPYVSGYYKTITESPVPISISNKIDGGTNGENIFVGGQLYMPEFWQETYDMWHDKDIAKMAIGVTMAIVMHEMFHNRLFDEYYKSRYGRYGLDNRKTVFQAFITDEKQFCEERLESLFKNDGLSLADFYSKNKINKTLTEKLQTLVQNWIEDYYIERIIVPKFGINYTLPFSLVNDVYFGLNQYNQVLNTAETSDVFLDKINALLLFRNMQHDMTRFVKNVLPESFVDRYIVNIESMQNFEMKDLKSRAHVVANVMYDILNMVDTDELQKKLEEQEAQEQDGDDGEGEITKEQVMEALGNVLKKIFADAFDENGNLDTEKLDQLMQDKANQRMPFIAKDERLDLSGQELETINQQLERELTELLEATLIINSSKESITNTEFVDLPNMKTKRNDPKVNFIKSLNPFAIGFISRRKKRHEERYLQEGQVFDQRNLDRWYDGSVFSNPAGFKRGRGDKPAVVLMLDVSGSTGSSITLDGKRTTVFDVQCDVGYTFHEILARAGIPISSLAHTTSGSHSNKALGYGSTTQRIYYMGSSNGGMDINGKPISYKIDVIKDSYNKLANNADCAGNADGGALRIACKFAGERDTKIIVMVSDGLPSESITQLDADDDLLYAINEAKKNGFTVIGIASAKEVYNDLKKYYGEKNTFKAYGTQLEINKEVQRLINVIYRPE